MRVGRVGGLKAELEEVNDGMREGRKEPEGAKGRWRRRGGTRHGFESMLQQLPDKLVFPGTPQENPVQPRIMQCINLREVILNTSLSIVLRFNFTKTALRKRMPSSTE